MPPTIRITNDAEQGDTVAEELTAKEQLAAQQAASFLEKLDASSNLEEVQNLISNARKQGEELQREFVRNALRKLYPFEPRPGQTRMVWQILFAQRDGILLAKTSFGKSVILQAPSVIVPDSISLVILPLDKIGEEQCEKISKLPAARPCLVKQETETPKLIQDIKSGNYTHILMGPEQALGKEMRMVIRSPCFQNRLMMVAIDEAHLISQWGDSFRKDYSKLVALRGLIPRNVPFIACSATLNQMTLKDVIQKAGFKKDVEIFRTSIDRPEITYIVQRLKPKTIGTFVGLYFALDKAVNNNKVATPLEIDKTVIFMDSRAKVQKALQSLRHWLKQKGGYTTEMVNEVIQPYFSTTSKHDKERVYKEFQKTNSKIRIVIATEALALGVDIPDVKRVIQYGFPTILDLAVLYQRWGRAARAEGMSGEAIWLVPQWVFGSKTDSQKRGKKANNSSRLQEVETIDESQASSIENSMDELSVSDGGEGTRKRRKSAYERRAALPYIIYMFLNSDSCLRSILLEFFDEAMADPLTRLPLPLAERCCSRCNPTLVRYTPLPTPMRVNYAPKNSLQWHVLADVKAWAADHAPKLVASAGFRLPPTVLLSKDTMMELACKSSEIHTIPHLHAIVGSDWLWMEKHGKYLLDNLKIWSANAVLKHSAKSMADRKRKEEQNIAMKAAREAEGKAAALKFSQKNIAEAEARARAKAFEIIERQKALDIVGPLYKDLQGTTPSMPKISFATGAVIGGQPAIPSPSQPSKAMVPPTTTLSNLSIRVASPSSSNEVFRSPTALSSLDRTNF